MTRLKNIWHSTLSLPNWVIIWVFVFLAPANLVCFFLMDTKIGFWASIANVLMFPTNILLIWLNQGMSRALSVPHLFAWFPLVGYVAYRLATGTDIGQVEWIYGVALLIINVVSLAFDTVDSLKWWRGEREIVGRPDAVPVI